MQKIKSLDALNNEVVSVIMFHAEWCGSCRQIYPKFCKLSEKYNKLDCYDIDVDECLDIAEQYKIEELPTIIAFRNGKEYSRWDESVEDLDAWMEFLSLDW